MEPFTEGPRFAKFCEVFLRHTKGRWAGSPLVFEPWQREFWNEALELTPDGQRVYREVGLGLPRKNGKSTIAAGIGLYGLVADGENEPEVYVGAGAQQQAGIVMGQSRNMALRSGELAPYVKVSTYRIEGLRNGGIMRALSSDGGLQHGLNPSTNIIDEVHAHKDGSLYTALTTGTLAREQPFTFWITTAGTDDDNLLADLHGQMYTGPGSLERRSDSLVIYRDKVNGVLVWWYGAPRDADISDPRVWASCNPASWLQDGTALGRERVSLVSKGRELEWRIYHLNQIMGVEDSWLPEGAWRALRVGEPSSDDPWHGLDESLPIGVGIEKSYAVKSAAIVVAQRQADRMVVRAKHFGATATTPLPAEAIRVTLVDLARRFPKPMARDPKNPRRALAGPAFAFDEQMFSESAEMLDEQGLNMVTFAQVASTMAPATTMTYEFVMSGRLVHDGDPILDRHVTDSTVLLTERGMKLMKGKRRANSSAIAMAMAIAMANVDAPQPYVRKPRVARGF